MPRPPTRLTNCCVPLIHPCDDSNFGSTGREDEQTIPLNVEEDEEYTKQDDKNADAENEVDLNETNIEKNDTRGRGPRSVRPLLLQTLSSAAGRSNDNGNGNGNNRASTYVEWGTTKVLCQVQAPVQAHQLPSHVLPLPVMTGEHGILYVQVKYAPHMSYAASRILSQFPLPLLDSAAGQQQQQQQQQRLVNTWMEAREAAMSRSLHAALNAAIALDQYPHAAIAIYVTVLQDDGGALAAAICAASLALTQAQVFLYDLVVAAQVAIVFVDSKNNHEQPKSKSSPQQQQQSNAEDEEPDETTHFDIWVDPTEDELLKKNHYNNNNNNGHVIVMATLSLAWMPNRKLVTLWEQLHNGDDSNDDTIPTTLGPQAPRMIPPSVTTRALQMCRQVCSKVLHPKLRQHIIHHHHEQQQQQPPPPNAEDA